MTTGSSKEASQIAEAADDGAQERARRFARNLNAFKRYYGSLHAKLAAIQQPQTTLVFGDDGEPDIEFRGGRLYGRGGRSYAEAQVARYWSAQDRVALVPPQSSMLDQVGGAFVYKVLRRAVDAGIEFSAQLPRRDSFFLVVFGVGLGFHIDLLLKETRSKAVLLIEPNIEFLYQSLFVYDWAALFEQFEERERRLLFCVTNNHDRMEAEIRNFIRMTGVGFFDSTHIFAHYKNSAMEVAHNEVRKDASVFLTGLGFLEDEIDMIRQSFDNLNGYEGRTFRKSTAWCGLPAFVVGCGPSLDKGLEVIKKNRDKAIIISCGTTLGVLLANGIVPDFQVEMENVEVVRDLMKDRAAQYDLSDVCLVASTTIVPGVTALFKKNVLFFRHSLASYRIFNMGAASGLSEVGPTVTNAGVAFAQEIGCTELYFFGIDFGSIRADRHHADGSDYGEGARFENTNIWEIQRPANFGGVAHTHHLFLWARTTVEQSILRYKAGRTYYNCSDGLAIDGAKPKLPKTVAITATVDKAKELERIMNGFPVYTREDFEHAWFAQDWAKKIEDTCAELIAFCEEEEDPAFRERYLVKIARRLLDAGGDPAFEQMMVRGSLQMVLMAATFYLNRVAAPDREAEMERIVREEMVGTIERVRDEAVEFLTGLWKDPKPSWVK